ncbi:MAG TPA: hypothetical protein VGD37_40930, partial [Kofleriaceae bacterium]
MKVAEPKVMPRKQRFKPSRKPKPIPQSEATTIGHDTRNTGQGMAVHNDNIEIIGGPSRMRDEPSSQEP